MTMGVGEVTRDVSRAADDRRVADRSRVGRGFVVARAGLLGAARCARPREDTRIRAKHLKLTLN